MLGVSWKQLLIHSTLLSLLWFSLAGGELSSWVVGVPTLMLALVVSLRLRSSYRLRVQWHLLPGFLFGLLVDMFRGAMLTARVALNPDKRLRPGMVHIPVELGSTFSRTLLINILNLVPGTLSVALQGDVLRLHVLDVRIDVATEVERLQRRVAAIFCDVGEA